MVLTCKEYSSSQTAPSATLRSVCEPVSSICQSFSYLCFFFFFCLPLSPSLLCSCILSFLSLLSYLFFMCSRSSFFLLFLLSDYLSFRLLLLAFVFSSPLLLHLFLSFSCFLIFSSLCPLASLSVPHESHEFSPQSTLLFPALLLTAETMKHGI